MAIQVKEATKNGQGNSLPALERQFISFSYGGKNIEDFNLLAVFTSDRLNKQVYADFKDVTTEIDEMDGQYFWLSHFEANSLDFSLATDGMTAKELEEFKEWFVPGIERELILTEYDNRGIMARIKEAPSMSLLPFEETVTMNIGGQEKSFRTNLYKGDITITFVMDDPHWYSLKSYFDGELTESMMKTIYEDGIPHTSMLTTNSILAGKYYYDASVSSIIQNKGITIGGQEDGYLYYCGTAEAKPIISFTLTPSINANSNYVEFTKSGNDDYYYLSIGKKKMSFALPEIMSAYNSALDIVDNYGVVGNSILDLRSELRDGLYDYYIRAWAMKIIDKCRGDSTHTYVSADGAIKSGFKKYFITNLKTIWDNSSLSFVINSKTGEAVVAGTVNGNNISEKCGNMIKSQYIRIEENKRCNEQGNITATECLVVTSNASMTNLIVDYKYMYL